MKIRYNSTGISEICQNFCSYPARDADGNEYIDFCRGLGPTILGSCDEEFVKALKDNLEKSASILGSGMLNKFDKVLREISQEQ